MTKVASLQRLKAGYRFAHRCQGQEYFG